MKTSTNIPFKKKLRKRVGDIYYKFEKLKPWITRGIRILVYHSITDNLIENDWDEKTTPKNLFEKQMEYLAENKYNIINCRQAVECLITQQGIPAKAVVITFDDGYRDNYLNAFPILKKYNFCATIFVTLDFLKECSGNSQALSCSEMIEMQNSGIISFGCHGESHKVLTSVDRHQLNKELNGAKQELEDIFKEKIDLFAYPFGHNRSYNKDVIKAVKAAGFAGAFTAVFGLNNFETARFLMKRNRISWFDELDEFEKNLHGAYDWYGLSQHFCRKRYHF